MSAPVVRIPVAVFVDAVPADLGNRLALSPFRIGTAARGETGDVALDDAKSAGPDAFAATAQPGNIVGGTVAVVIQAVADFGGHHAAYTAGIQYVVVDGPVAVIILPVAHLRARVTWNGVALCGSVWPASKG